MTEHLPTAALAGTATVWMIVAAVALLILVDVARARLARLSGRAYDRGYDDGFAVARRLLSGRPSRQPIPYCSTHAPTVHPPLHEDATDVAEEGLHDRPDIGP